MSCEDVTPEFRIDDRYKVYVYLDPGAASAELARMVEELRIWSGSLPAILGPNVPARPWNGRQLTKEEREGALDEYWDHGPQAALEWLSEHAW